MNNQGPLENLKQYIASRGDTQEKLAEALGMHRTRLNAKLNERNGEVFTAPDMQAICAYYDIPTEQRTALFFGAR